MILISQVLKVQFGIHTDQQETKLNSCMDHKIKYYTILHWLISLAVRVNPKLKQTKRPPFVYYNKIVPLQKKTTQLLEAFSTHIDLISGYYITWG